MIQIKTFEGVVLSVEDTNQLIIIEMQRDFENLSDFLKCKEIRFSDYWGDVELLGTEEDYSNWITYIAKQVLKA